MAETMANIAVTASFVRSIIPKTKNNRTNERDIENYCLYEMPLPRIFSYTSAEAKTITTLTIIIIFYS